MDYVILISMTAEKLCPRCPPDKKRPRYVDKRGKMHGYCHECRNEYQATYQKQRYKPVAKPEDGRGFHRRLRDAKNAMADKFGLCCVCEEEARSWRSPSGLGEECLELIQTKKLVLTPHEYYLLRKGEDLRNATDKHQYVDPAITLVPFDDDGNVPGSPWNDVP